MMLTPKAVSGLTAALCLCGLARAASSAAAPPFAIGPTVSISSDAPRTPLGETWLAANPRNPDVMIAVSMAFPKAGPWASVMYRTTDGGKSWHRVTHGAKHERYFWGADPYVTFGPDGTAYYTDLEWGAVGNADFDQVASSHDVPLSVRMFRSTDGGASWSEPIALDGVDHSMMAMDDSGGKYSGRVYVAYTSAMASAQGKRIEGIGFAYSDDQGRTYKQRVFAPPEVTFRDRIRVGPSPTDMAVTPDGLLVLPYLYYLAPPSTAADQGQVVQQTWVITSADGGRTFSEPHLVATSEFPLAKIRESKIDYWPRMAVDGSHGVHRGRLYITNESIAGHRVRIGVLSSDDQGQTWSPRADVNDDSSDSDSNTAGIAVSGNGELGVSWYDRRNDPKNECFQEYFSASLDGGVTFLPNAPVRAPRTCTLQRGNWQPNVSQSLDASRGTYSVSLSSPGLRFINAGETQGIVGLEGGEFRLAWIDGESGVMRLAGTEVRVTGRPLGTDVGDLVEVDTTRPTIDYDAHTASMEVTVINRWHAALPGPLTLVLSDLSSGFRGLRAVNADNGLPSVGASWTLGGGAAGRSSFEPGQATQTVTLKFAYGKAPGSMEDTPPFVSFHIFANPR